MMSSCRVFCSVCLVLAVAAGTATAGYASGDDFNDGVIDTARWEGPYTSSPMEYQEAGGQFQYRSTAATSGWPTTSMHWGEFDCLYGYDWSATVDVSNPAAMLPGVAGVGEEEVSSVALVLYPSTGGNSFLTLFLQTKFVAYESSQYTAHRIIIGYWANGTPIDISGDIIHNFPSDIASLGYSWDASAQELQVLYDADGGQDNMVLWHTLDVAEWGMGPSDEFTVSVQGQVINAMTDWADGQWADDFNVTSEVPEPATVALVALGLAGLAARRKRK